MNSQFTERPVVGICARTAQVSLRGVEVTVSLTFQPNVDLLASAGCDVVLLPLLPSAYHVVDELDGLLVPGGPDVNPALYGGSQHPETRNGDPAMDAAEVALVRKALSAGLPLLAICRGMQLLNVQCGGSLHQHLPEVIGHDRHCPQTGAFVMGKHAIEVRPSSRLAGIFADDVPQTSCHHHQAVDRLGAGLEATARAPDGVVEAVEVTDHPFAVGVQWEADQTGDDRLHQALAEAARHASPRRKSESR